MKNYELTYILSPRLTTDQVAKHSLDVETFIQGNQGVIIKSEKTAAQMLAYPIKKERSGYFVISEFQAAETTLPATKSHVDKLPDVLRSFIVVKRPMKEMKEPRRRKPVSAATIDAVTKEDKKGEKADMQEIDKKLDELLS